jgi:hypothetical protein
MTVDVSLLGEDAQVLGSRTVYARASNGELIVDSPVQIRVDRRGIVERCTAYLPDWKYSVELKVSGLYDVMPGDSVTLESPGGVLVRMR